MPDGLRPSGIGLGKPCLVKGSGLARISSSTRLCRPRQAAWLRFGFADGGLMPPITYILLNYHKGNGTKLGSKQTKFILSIKETKFGFKTKYLIFFDLFRRRRTNVNEDDLSMEVVGPLGT